MGIIMNFIKQIIFQIIFLFSTNLLGMVEEEFDTFQRIPLENPEEALKILRHYYPDNKYDTHLLEFFNLSPDIWEEKF